MSQIPNPIQLPKVELSKLDECEQGSLYQIRQMTSEDLDAVCLIETQCFTDDLTATHFFHHWKTAYQLVAVAKQSGDVIGYIQTSYESSLKPDQVNMSLNISALATVETWRQKGIATALLEAVRMMVQLDCAEVTQMTLEVRRSNASAIKVYEKIGFHKDDVLPNYYSSPTEDALVMTCNL